MVDNTKSDLLWKIHEELIRSDEKLKALKETNKMSHETILKEISETCTKVKDLDTKILALEKDGVKLGIFWKFLVIVAPIVITLILRFLGL